MKKLNKIKSIQSTTAADSSFDEESNESNAEFHQENTDMPKKYLEDYDLDEIYNFIEELDKSEYIIDMNLIFKKEKETVFFPEEKIDNNNLCKCKELFNIVYKKKTPFKPLKEPKKVNLKGKIFANDENGNIIYIN